MQAHQIKLRTKNKPKKRVGRGGKRGTYSGRGLKGQKSRAGRKIRPQMRDTIKRIPKKRGHRFSSKDTFVASLNLNVIEEKFNDDEEVTPQVLFDKKLIKKKKGRLPRVKFLGHGDLKKKINFSGCEFSRSAEGKIKKAKGKIDQK